MSGSPLFTSVTVSWNSADYLGSCIKALRKAGDHAQVPLEIIVVDNSSVDRSVEIAREAGADLVMRNPLNAGFAVAASQGVARAHGSWIVMINPDLVVEETFLNSIATAVQRAPEQVACFAPEIRFSADTARVNSRGIAVDTFGFPREIDKGQLANQASDLGPVFAGSGGGAVLRRSALDRVGAFEPLYFAYYEDVDLGWRLQRAGFSGEFLGSARASHAGSSTTGVASPLQTYLVARNRRFLFFRHGPHNWRARIWRLFIDSGHASVSCALTRSGRPLFGRLAALLLRPYLSFLRRRDSEHFPDSTVGLADPPPLKKTLRRKLRSVALERQR